MDCGRQSSWKWNGNTNDWRSKKGRRPKCRTTNPDQGAQKNSTGRRPLRGAVQALLLLFKSQKNRLRLVVFVKADLTLARRSKCTISSSLYAAGLIFASSILLYTRDANTSTITIF
jgi:hypothetical protein